MKKGYGVKDDNFIKENNAKHLWHPMGHPADSLANPPKVIVSAQNSSIKDIDGHETVDAVGGLWCVPFTFFTTVDNLFPVFLPFFSPIKFKFTYRTYFSW